MSRRAAQCQTTNQKLTVRLGSQHSDPSQGDNEYGDGDDVLGVLGLYLVLSTMIGLQGGASPDRK